MSTTRFQNPLASMPPSSACRRQALGGRETPAAFMGVWGRPSIAALLLLLLAGCGSEPFPIVPVSGKVTYEDGSPIPVDPMTLRFIPQTPPINPKTYPPSGTAYVDKATGEFSVATTRKTNDGLVRGKHKVVVLGGDGMPLRGSIVPAEYGDPTKTPLEVDTDDQPFRLTVPKPHR